MIIGLYGFQGCGKSSVASEVENLSTNWRCASFAGVLRKRLQLITPANIDVYDTKIKNDPQECYGGLSIREMLQKDGAFQRSLNPDVFVNSIRNLYQEVYGTKRPCIIIDDLRYFNESKFIKDNLGFIIRVEREIVPVQYGAKVESELDWKSFKSDLTVNNFGPQGVKNAAKIILNYIDITS
jgi:hypothetical protein